MFLMEDCVTRDYPQGTRHISEDTSLSSELPVHTNRWLHLVFLKHLSSAVSLSQLLITGLIGVLFPVILFCRCSILQVCKRLNTPVRYPRHTGKCFSDWTETVRTSDFPDPTTFLDSTQNKLLLEGARTIILQNRMKSRLLASELNTLSIDITERIYNKNVTINWLISHQTDINFSWKKIQERKKDSKQASKQAS